MQPIRIAHYPSVVFFTGAGMSAECGIPTYRGHGGIWHQYNYEEYACQQAFERDPRKVLDFHELRRTKVLGCEPHAGHHHLTRLQGAYAGVQVITQNIDGMHQRAGTRVAAELHGSLWRMRCRRHGVRADLAAAAYAVRSCEQCGAPQRPDITWFGDTVDEAVFRTAGEIIGGCGLFVAIGTSGVVWPAAGMLGLARQSGARTLEINIEPTGAGVFDEAVALPASLALPALFPV